MNGSLPWVILAGGIFFVPFFVYGVIHVHNEMDAERQEAEARAEAEQRRQAARRRFRAMSNDDEVKFMKDVLIRLRRYTLTEGVLTVAQICNTYADRQEVAYFVMKSLLSRGLITRVTQEGVPLNYRGPVRELLGGDHISIVESASENFLNRSPEVQISNNLTNIQANQEGQVNYKSKVSGSQNRTVQNFGPGAVRVLEEFGRIVREEGDQEAVRRLDEFLRQAQEDRPNRLVLQALFEWIVGAVPALTGVAGLVSSVRDLISS